MLNYIFQLCYQKTLKVSIFSLDGIYDASKRFLELGKQSLQQLITKDVDVNGHERLSNWTLRHNWK